MGKKIRLSNEYMKKLSKEVVRKDDSYINITKVGKVLYRSHHWWLKSNSSMIEEYGSYLNPSDSHVKLYYVDGKNGTFAHPLIAEKFIKPLSRDLWGLIELNVSQKNVNEINIPDSIRNNEFSSCKPQNSKTKNGDSSDNKIDFIYAPARQLISSCLRTDGYINATRLGHQFGKRWDDYKNTDSFKSTIGRLSRLDLYPRIYREYEFRKGLNYFICPYLAKGFTDWLNSSIGEIYSSIAGQIYCIKSSDAIKVGYSIDAINRIQQIQRWEGELCIVSIVAGRMTDEKYIHKKLHLSGNYLGDEWYPLSMENRILYLLDRHTVKFPFLAAATI